MKGDLRFKLICKKATRIFGLPDDDQILRRHPAAQSGARLKAFEAKAAVVLLLIETFGYANYAVARFFSQNHTTMLNASARAKKLLETDARFNMHYEKLKFECESLKQVDDIDNDYKIEIEMIVEEAKTAAEKAVRAVLGAYFSSR